MAVVLVLGFTGCTTKINELGGTECRGVITDRLYDSCDKVETVYDGVKKFYSFGKQLVLINGYWISTDIMDNLERLDAVAKQVDVSAEVIKDSIKAATEKKQDVISEPLTDNLN